jgi:hypothetical protein
MSMYFGTARANGSYPNPMHYERYIVTLCIMRTSTVCLVLAQDARRVSFAQANEGAAMS